MRIVVLGSPPDEVEQLIRRRQEQGLDTFDEVWEGNYHMAPAGRARHAFLDDALAVLLHPYAEAAGLFGSGPFNLGVAEDYRVPDRGYHTARPDVIYFDTAVVVVEIVSPDDETYAKFDFYATHRVAEIFAVEPDDHRVRIFVRDGKRYAEVAHSAALGADAAVLEEAIAWP